MPKQVTLPVRPGQAVKFPNVCVACGQPASDDIAIRKRHGQTLVRLDVPVCAECARLAQRRSGREESLLRMGWLAAAVGGLLAFVLVWFLAGDLGTWGRIAAGLIAAAVAGGLAYWAFRRSAQAAELPEKRAVTRAVEISDFSWRDVTLMLTDAALADRVAAMNAPAPMADADPQAEERE